MKKIIIQCACIVVCFILGYTVALEASNNTKININNNDDIDARAGVFNAVNIDMVEEDTLIDVYNLPNLGIDVDIESYDNESLELNIIDIDNIKEAKLSEKEDYLYIKYEDSFDPEDLKLSSDCFGYINWQVYDSEDEDADIIDVASQKITKEQVMEILDQHEQFNNCYNSESIICTYYYSPEDEDVKYFSLVFGVVR